MLDFGFLIVLALSFLVPIGIIAVIQYSGRIRKRRIMTNMVVLTIIISISIGSATSVYSGSWATSPIPNPGPYSHPPRITIPSYEYQTYQFLSNRLQIGQKSTIASSSRALVNATWYEGTNILSLMGIPMLAGLGYMAPKDNTIYSLAWE